MYKMLLHNNGSFSPTLFPIYQWIHDYIHSLCETYFLISLQWRNNECDGVRVKSQASRLFTQLFIQSRIKEKFKALRHWPLCGEFTGDRWIPVQMVSNAENVSMLAKLPLVLGHGSVITSPIHALIPMSVKLTPGCKNRSMVTVAGATVKRSHLCNNVT